MCTFFISVFLWTACPLKNEEFGAGEGRWARPIRRWDPVALFCFRFFGAGPAEIDGAGVAFAGGWSIWGVRKHGCHLGRA